MDSCEKDYLSGRTIRIYGVVGDSIVDGPHLRYCIFVQGCSHDCPGCHNPESHDPKGGEERSLLSLLEDIHANPLVRDVTFSGGEPFEQAASCAALAQVLKAEGYGIWAYSGYTYEQLLSWAESDEDVQAFLDCLDVLVDGPFIEARKSYQLRFKGSSNQRIIDLAQTRLTGKVAEWAPEELSFEKPPSW